MGQKGRQSLANLIALQAPLEMGNQVELEDLIELSKQRDAARKKGDGALASLLQDFSIAKSKSEKNRQRKNGKPAELLGPTPERAAKAEGLAREHKPDAQAIEVSNKTKSHTIVSPIDRYGKHWPAEIELAARKLRNLFLLAESGDPKMIASYGGAGGAAYGPRDGGVADHIREARATVDLIKARFPSCVPVIEAFITQVTCGPGGTAIRFQDIGAQHCPWGTPDAQKGAGYGRLIQTLMVLEWFLNSTEGGDLSRPELAQNLETAIRAGAQIMREREERRRKDRERTKVVKGGR